MPVSPSSLVARRLGTNSFESRLCRTKGKLVHRLILSPIKRNDRTRLKFFFLACKKYTFFCRPEIRRDYPLNLSISLSGGKETNKDSPSNGE